MTLKPYKTIKGSAESLTVINKSRFIGHAANAESPEQAMAAYDAVKKQQLDATHHCYAYIIGKNKEFVKFSDDGEPGGTAGLPMAEALKQSGLTDIITVVSRYFGGVKLGSGGLVRAYSSAVSETLKTAETIRFVPCGIYQQSVDYDVWAKIASKVEAAGAKIVNIDYQAVVDLEIGIKDAEVQKVRAIFQEALRTEDILTFVSEEYMEES